MRDFSLGCGPMSTFPPSVQRELMSGLVMCGIGEKKEEFLTKVGECWMWGGFRTCGI